ncbi:MAG TPA: CRTAC1 family protein, partial [Bacteroidetes bacterium]|nr:CRTAC1 family protein [Bacteroidota bacterium]
MRIPPIFHQNQAVHTMHKALPILLLCILGLSIKLYAQTFSEVSQAAGIDHYTYNPVQMGAGVAWFDYDADGDEDLYFTGGAAPSKLYRNNGDGTFSDVTQASGLYIPAHLHTQGVVTGDLDNDGYREVFIGTQWIEPNFLFHNNGDGTFTDISLTSGIEPDSNWIASATFGDVNLDGLLDLYTASYVWEGRILYDSLFNPIGYDHRCKPNSLWLNNGNGTFSDIAAAYGVADTGCALSVVFTDFDGDHDADILVANDFGEWVKPSALYQSAYPAPFADISVSAQMDVQMYGMGIGVGDYDHDLDLDYYVTNIGWNGLFNNQGNAIFQDTARWAGVRNDSINGKRTTGWGNAWIDFDLDSWQDLFVANGYIQMIPTILNEQNDPDKMFRNNGDGTFSDIGNSMGLGNTWSCRGMAIADYDLDGDPDMAVGVIRIDTSSTNHSLLYKNEQNTGNHWLKVRVQGTVNNRDGFGTQLSIRANGTQWLHEINGGSGHMSQHSSIAHLGLGSANKVDSLFVIWPDGNVQLLTDIPADSFITVVEDPNQYLGISPFAAMPPKAQLHAQPNPTTGATRLILEMEVGTIGKWIIMDAF